ncbi:winged helix-turn-helix domain-containing protein [Bradyrhizobium sp. WSM3983]|uniref:winged helix-turn-helix domain-containing protein n=1 Tax=Bradyrhizobium sp. WSM3983 TaxID=1038867 RepID=UPI001FDA8BAD|nr:winged helix-turn-helix domain-containing protein [Bradyrhizobium sp. WSM3983]
MLRLFAANTGRVLSKQDLMETVWPNVHVGEDSLFQCIREIRAGLGDNKRQIVRVISGRGYLFDAEGTDTAAVDLPEQAATSQSARVAPDAEAPVETSSIAATRRFAFRLRSRFCARWRCRARCPRNRDCRRGIAPRPHPGAGARDHRRDAGDDSQRRPARHSNGRGCQRSSR